MTRTLIATTITAIIVTPVALTALAIASAATQGDFEPDSTWDNFEDEEEW